ncbi:hypothetical protein EW026_g5174 [Hermanssonia centrifuga]|uniref:Methyltransferase domain-containing protein n=1 Tax=Hermanssonia centrifuga TaxID=98765 RepID=A0A4S4KFU6_9APHY|nr:hypothetical protein EW026_g5174 [Hermanssonia centrifuga]
MEHETGGSIFYTLWDFFIPAFNCPHRVDRLGALGDGGKWICGVDRLAMKHDPCVVYSFGVNHDSSFEAAFLTRAPNCQIWGYDFSVSSWGPEITENPALAPLCHFNAYALGAEDKPHDSPPTYTIDTLMKMNGHKFIDILKIDIEGGEFETLAQFVEPYLRPDGPGLPIGQLEIEIHAWANNGDFEKFLTWWENLERGGLRPFWTEPNIIYVSHLRTRPDLAEYSFINVKERHALIADGY